MFLTLVAAAVLSQATNPELIDVSEVRDSLKLWSDGHGHYLAGRTVEYLFYGDGKAFYESAPFIYTLSGEAYQMRIRDPRYSFGTQPEVDTQDGETLNVTCGKRHATLTKVKSDVAKPMLAKAVFKRGPMTTRAYALARDDKGTYYYVERGRFDDNERLFRVFVGQRGNMREMKLNNIVHDTAGDIFATPTGDLRLVLGDEPTTEWVHDDKHEKLIVLPVSENTPLIYNELGVYKKLKMGTPCDDL